MRTIDEKTEYYGQDRKILCTTIATEEDSETTKYYVRTYLSKKMEGEDSDLHYVVEVSDNTKKFSRVDIPSKGSRYEQLVLALTIHFKATDVFYNGIVPKWTRKSFKDLLEQ